LSRGSVTAHPESQEPHRHPRTFRSGRAEYRAVLGLFIVFAVSRVLYGLAGVRFDTAVPLRGYMHFIDVRLLQHDLWNSLWHFHAQPPLFNLFLGMVLHLPGSHGAWFHVFFVTMGAALTVTMFLLMRELGVSVGLAFVTTALFVVLPVTVLYENFLLYTYPVALLLLVSGLFLVRYLRTRRPLYGFVFFGALAALVLLRGTFHLAWLLAVAVGILIFARPRSHRALALLLIPVIAAVFWYGKNWVQFGITSSSSWAGMNLAKVTLQQAPRAELEDLVRRGELSRQALIVPFSAPEVYQPLPRRTGIAVLDEHRKTGGAINYNHMVYVKVSDRYFDDAVRFIRAHPTQYTRTVGYSFRFFWLPGSDWRSERPITDGLDRFLNRFLFLQPRGYFSHELHGYTSPVSTYAPDLAQMAWGPVLVYLAVWVTSISAAWAVLRRKQLADRARTVTIAFLGLTVLYATVVSNAFEVGENNRFRFETDPVVWVLFVVLLARLAHGASTRFARRRIPPNSEVLQDAR